LDRQTIERKDFPIGRRGYEPEAVDEHLARLAREVDALKRTKASAEPAAPAEGRRSGESLASVASSQVQAIVEAAEASAAAIEREAQEQAEQSAQDAARDAQRIRDEAVERSQEHVGKVHEATSLMLQRVDAMESELGALVESLRTGANRLNADLSLLSGNMGELYEAAGRPSADTLPAAPIVEDVTIVDEADAVEQVEDVVEPAPIAPAEPDTGSDGDTAAADEEIEGARLIALNMALNGQPRAETDKYLEENFDLSDRDALLDEVYATVEG
ncbi:MAG: DivIVA domain-containing protein, partial [Actinomycetota bacterium]|nr:DivIVA domain-containing protein [Actinomycetota bacterium]